MIAKLKSFAAPGLCCLLLLLGCEIGTPTEGDVHPIIAGIGVVSGDSQVGRTGDALADPIVVRVFDVDGDPIESAGVVFAITSGGGTLSDDSAETDQGGLAVTYWTLGEGPLHTLDVYPADERSGAHPVTITATNALVLQLKVLSGADQVALSGDALAEPVVVLLEDCYGEPMPGVSLRFEVIRGNGSVAESEVTSDEFGTAQVTWSLGKGPDNRLLVGVLDDSLSAIPVVVRARTEISLTFTWWISDVPFYGGVDHDNRILESDHFLIFSNGDSDSAKINMAKHTERYLAELLQDFEIDSAGELGIDTANRTTKITVYSMREFLEQGQIAFPFGFFHAGFDSEPYLDWGIHNQRFFNSIKHETTHVLNFLVTDNHLNGQHWWFTEGIAEYASGGGEPRIETWADVQKWWSVDGHTNPIAIRRFPSDLPDPDGDWIEYYPMFHLAVEYLLSETGYGMTLVDVKNMWTDMANGEHFEAAFQTHIGMTVDVFEGSLYERLSQYMDR